MKDWEELRDELASIEEQNSQIDDMWLEVCDFDPNRSLLRDANSEDELADRIEINLFWLVNHNILTDEISTKYKDFFDRHGLPTDIKAYNNEKVGELAVKRYKEENGIVDDVPDYKSDCRRARKHIGRQLRDARMTRADSIADASKRTGIPEGLIARIEAGRSNAEIDTIAILAKAYNAKITIYGQ